MGLEKRLAEVEVLAGDLASRSYAVDYEGQIALGNRLEELRTDVENLGEAYHKAKKLLKGKKRGLAAGVLGDVGKRQKNVADNLNRLMQLVYSGRAYDSDKDIDLRKLEENTKSAPLLDNGQSLYYYFMRFHAPRNTLSRTRNDDGHGNTLRTIRSTEEEDRKTHGIKERYFLLSRKGPVGAREWMETEMESYLAGAKTILDKISQEGPELFASPERRGSVFMQRLRNFGNRHKAGVALAGSSAILAGGVVGGLLLDDVLDSRRDKIIAEKHAEASQLYAGAQEFLAAVQGANLVAVDISNQVGGFVEELEEPYKVAHAILCDRHKREPEVLERLGTSWKDFYPRYNAADSIDHLSQEFLRVSLDQRFGTDVELLHLNHQELMDLQLSK